MSVKDTAVGEKQTVMYAKQEVELIFSITPLEKNFNVEYLENGEKYDVGIQWRRI